MPGMPDWQNFNHLPLATVCQFLSAKDYSSCLCVSNSWRDSLKDEVCKDLILTGQPCLEIPSLITPLFHQIQSMFIWGMPEARSRTMAAGTLPLLEVVN
jgi:hypothetical protein